MIGTTTFVFMLLFTVAPAVPGEETNEIEYLDLRYSTLDAAVRILNEEAGINIVATESALDKKISLFLQDVSVREAVDTICKCHSMWFREDEESNIIRIMTLAEYQKDLVVFREEMTHVFTLHHPNSVDVGVAIRDVYGKRVVLSLGKDQIYDEQRELEQRFNRLDLLDQRGQFTSQRSGQGTGYGSGRYGGSNSSRYGGYGSGQYGGSSRYGGGYGRTGAQQGMEYEAVDAGSRLEGAEITTERAARAAELEVEGAITGDAAIEAGRLLKDEEAPIYVTVITRNNQVVVRTGDAEAMSAIEELVARLDVDTPQVLLEVKVLSVLLSDEFESVFDLFWSTKDVGEPNPKSVRSGGGDPTAAGDLVTGGGGFLWQYLDSNFQFQLQMLEDEGRVTTVATPLLLVANNEVSKVFVGEERPIVQGVHTETVTTSLQTANFIVVPEIEMRNVGTTLLFTPNINSNRTVTLRILQEDSDISDDQAEIPVSNGLGEVEPFPVDVVETRSVTGTVVAKDGLTVAIGGIIEERILDQDTGIPVLKDIPLLGIFFSDINTLKERRELVVLIRPMVLMTPEEAEKESSERLAALSIHPYQFGREDSLETFQPEDVPGFITPGPSWVHGLRLHQIGVLTRDEDESYRTETQYYEEETYPQEEPSPQEEIYPEQELDRPVEVEFEPVEEVLIDDEAIPIEDETVREK